MGRVIEWDAVLKFLLLPSMTQINQWTQLRNRYCSHVLAYTDLEDTWVCGWISPLLQFFHLWRISLFPLSSVREAHSHV